MKQITHYGDGMGCCGRLHEEPQRIAHNHGAMRHEHYVKIIDGKPEDHDYRAEPTEEGA